MYLGFHKLREMPFRLAPDPRFMYWSAGHAAARERIRAARQRSAGCVVLLGERGAGKTALLECLRLDASAPAAAHLDFPPRTLTELGAWLRENSGRATDWQPRLVLCDNGHLFPASMLAMLLRGAAPGGESDAAQCLVLAGEPHLARALDSLPSDVLPCERVAVPALSAVEVAAYIEHRLRVAGAGDARLFREDTCVEVHRETRGNPRLVNALCDAALLVACERELPQVGSAEIRRALEHIGRLLVAPAADAAPPPWHVSPGDDAEIPAAFAKLRLMHRERMLIERALGTGPLSIGRSSDNGLRIDSKYVSRHHCRIVTSERDSFIEDVHSTNGLFVNQRRVRRHQMRDGDVVQIGEFRLHYVDLRDGGREIP